MDKWQAVHTFWSSFGVKAYDENSVPDDANYPYITYDARIAQFEIPVLLTAQIWDRNTSWVWISQKTNEIAETVKHYHLIKVDDGFLFLTQGNPFAQRMNDPGDYQLRRMLININAEYFTES